MGNALMYLLITKVASELEIENMGGNIVFDDQAFLTYRYNLFVLKGNLRIRYSRILVQCSKTERFFFFVPRKMKRRIFCKWKKWDYFVSLFSLFWELKLCKEYIFNFWEIKKSVSHIFVKCNDIHVNTWIRENKLKVYFHE